MKTASAYLRAIHRRFSLLGAWPPNQRIDVGDVGVIEDGAFVRRSSLDRLDVPFEAVASGQPGSLEYSEGVEVSVGVHGKGSVASSLGGEGAPRVGLRLRLAKQGSFLFSALGAEEWSIGDSLAVERAVLKAWRAGTWDPAWVIVNRVNRVESLTVVISESDEGELDLSGTGAATAGPVQLGDVALGLEVAGTRGASLRFLGERAMTPLYGALQLNRRLVGRDRLESAPVSFVSPEDGEPVLEVVGIG